MLHGDLLTVPSFSSSLWNDPLDVIDCSSGYGDPLVFRFMTGSDGDLRLFYVEQGCQKTNALLIGLALNGGAVIFIFRASP